MLYKHIKGMLSNSNSKQKVSNDGLYKTNESNKTLIPSKIKKHINDDSLINHNANGYDHCFIKKSDNDDTIAILKDEKSKRKLKEESKRRLYRI